MVAPRGSLLGTRPAVSSRRDSPDLETIRRGLAEVWDTQGRKFVTFEARNRDGTDADRWVQYLDGEINVRWALDEEPGPALARRGVVLPRGAFVSWYAAGSNAVFGAGDVLIDDVARFIGDLFVNVVAGHSPCDVVARVELHG
jgi:hypothetical protein